MDCNQWRDMASEYLEGTLPSGAHEAMRLHVASCAACRRDEAGLRVLCRELNVLPSVDPPLFFADNVRSAIERQKNSRTANAPWWRTLFLGNSSGLQPSVYGQIGRVAVGTLLTGGAVAAIGWTLLLAGASPQGQTQANIVPGPGLADGVNTPGAGESSGGDPILKMTQVTTMAPGTGPAYDLSVWLDNADHGAARWKFVGDPQSYSIVLRHDAPQIVRVPYSVATGNTAIALSVHWTSKGQSHTRYILLPGAAGANGATSADAGHTEMPADRQSFGLSEESLVDASREMSARYGVPITLDDIPETLKVRITAQDETAADALRHVLGASGLNVTTDAAGIHVAPPAGSTTPAASEAVDKPDAG